MIILSSDFVLQQAAANGTAGDGNLPIIGWNNIVGPEDIMADTETMEWPAVNLANASTYLKWQGTPIAPPDSNHITVTINSVSDIDYIGIARHNFGSAGLAVSIEGHDGSSPIVWEQITTPIIPADDAPLIFRFLPQSYAQLRVVLTGDATPEAAVLYAGKLLVFEHGIQGDYTPMPFARTHNVITGRSEQGNFLGRIITRASLESSANIQFLTPEFYRSDVDPFLKVQADIPFFFAWAPDDFPDEVAFGWLTNDPMPAFDENGFVGLQFDMVGIVE